MRKPELERTYPDPDCGCPVEEWVADGVLLTLHFEDGEALGHADGGEWDTEIPLRATSLEAAREEAFAWVRALPREGELATLNTEQGERSDER